MKKNLNLKNIIVGTLVATLIISSTAFALDSSKAVNEDGTPVAEKTIENENENESKKAYNLVSGKVESIKDEGDYKQISITNDNGGMIFTVEDSVFVIDSKDNSYKTTTDIKEGMEITALLSNNSIMTMSLPPITPGAAGFIINSEGNSIDVSLYNDELVNEENSLKLNIDNTTQIVDITGVKKVFTADNIKNSEALVIYGATTRSIPAQTSPSFVMIVNNSELEEASKLEKENETESEKKENTETETPVATSAEEAVAATTLVPVREIANRTGFSIAWTANDKPVTLEKGNAKIEINVGNANYVLEGKEISLELKTELNKDDEKIYVDSNLEGILKGLSA